MKIATEARNNWDDAPFRIPLPEEIILCWISEVIDLHWGTVIVGWEDLRYIPPAHVMLWFPFPQVDSDSFRDIRVCMHLYRLDGMSYAI